MRDTRRIIGNPGRRKSARWRAALHEAAHAVAFARVCNVSATARVHADGSGHCSHNPVNYPFAEAVATLAGPAAEQGNWVRDVPTIRPRRSARRPRGLDSVAPDVAHLNVLRREIELARTVGLAEQSPSDPEAVTMAVDNFFHWHSAEIWTLARRLYRDGSAGVRPL
jgi:hypothetical protein